MKYLYVRPHTVKCKMLLTDKAKHMEKYTMSHQGNTG